jgi:hypothetical protein
LELWQLSFIDVKFGNRKLKHHIFDTINSAPVGNESLM